MSEQKYILIVPVTRHGGLKSFLIAERPVFHLVTLLADGEACLLQGAGLLYLVSDKVQEKVGVE